MTKLFRAVLAVLLVLSAGVCAAGPVTAEPTTSSVVAAAPLPVLTGHVRLMIAGDSTAAGQPVACGDGSHYGDRQVLGDWLNRVGGLDVEFVGSQASSCGQPFQHHEGRGGWTIGMLADGAQGVPGIAGLLAAHPADVLVLRVGVNDAKQSGGFHDETQMAADYTRLIENARSQNPAIRILASEVIPPDGAVTTLYLREFARASVTARKFNMLLPTIVAPYGDSVHIAHNGMITPVWLADGLHPSGQGYVGMAWILMQQPDGLWPWLSADPPPATKPWDVPIDPWRQ